METSTFMTLELGPAGQVPDGQVPDGQGADG
jgi:hypothetical protein